MTRDEAVRERTVERFLECEAKRSKGRAAALADGKSENEALEIADEAAKAHWNAWAENMLAKRKTLEKSGVWSAAIKNTGGRLEPSNAETLAWMEEAEASFSRCYFFSKWGDETKTPPEDDGGGA